MDTKTSDELLEELEADLRELEAGEVQPQPQKASLSSTSTSTAPKSPSISFRLEPEYIEGLDRLAQLDGVDRTEAIRKLIVASCRRREIPCKRAVLPKNGFEAQVQSYYIQQILNQLLRLPGLKITVGIKLNAKKQYDVQLTRPGEATPILVGASELHDISGAPSIYWYFPAQAGLAEQWGELSRTNTVFNLELPVSQ
jgi:hypothetical protein